MSDTPLQNKIDSFLETALKRFIVRDYDSAIRELKAAEMLDKDNPEILYNLGINYCRMGLDKTAVGYFKKLLNLKHAFIDALEVKKLIAYALIHIKEYRESEEYLDQVLQLVPSDLAAMNMKAFSLEMQDKHGAALRIYGSIIEADRNNYNAYNSIAYILAKTGGDPHQSLRFARVAHESKPEYPAYLDTLGYVYMKMGNLDFAEQYLTAASEKAPHSEEIKNHLKELRTVRKPSR
jgi:tetratricopeptide (TPR) repeat protein